MFNQLENKGKNDWAKVIDRTHVPNKHAKVHRKLLQTYGNNMELYKCCGMQFRG